MKRNGKIQIAYLFLDEMMARRGEMGNTDINININIFIFIFISGIDVLFFPFLGTSNSEIYHSDI